MPDSSTYRNVARLNYKFRTDPDCFALSWEYSEDLRLGQKVSQTSQGLWLAQPYLLRKKMCPSLRDQWVLCLLHEDQILPIDFPSGYVATQPGKTPTDEDTNGVMRVWRAWLDSDRPDVSGRDSIDRLEDAEIARRASDASTYRDAVRDAIPAGAGTPGAKDHRSFSSVIIFDPTKKDPHASSRDHNRTPSPEPPQSAA